MVEMPLEEILQQSVIPWGLNIFFALLTFIVGKWLVGGVTSLVRRLLSETDMDGILVDFVVSILNALLVLVVVVVALDRLGVDTTSLVALVGAAGLAIGLSLQDSLKNFAAGVMLILFRPFKTGDFIEASGVSGQVEKITIFNTVLKTADNKMVIVPNGSIYNGAIVNYSAHDKRRIDLVIGIGYDDDIKKAKAVLQSILDRDDRILWNPEPIIAVAELAESSVNFVVRPWVDTGDYWTVKYDLTEQIKLAFDENGISIPYPQMDVHLDK